MQTDGIEVASVGNTIILHESCLVEAFNLKAGIQFNLKNGKLIRKSFFFSRFEYVLLFELLQ
jgi:tetratricopeptide repeat protein 30